MKIYIRDKKIVKHYEIIAWLFKPYWKRSLNVLFIMFISGIFEMLNLAIFYPIMNYGLRQKSEGVILENFDQ